MFMSDRVCNLLSVGNFRICGLWLGMIDVKNCCAVAMANGRSSKRIQ